MASINEIVEINITRETRGVSRQGFGTPLFIGSTAGVLSTDERVRTYTSAEAVLGDFAEDDPEYIAALRFFGQQIAPTFIKIGYHDPTATESVDFTVTAGTDESVEVTVDSTAFSYNATTGDTAQDIITGLEADFATNTVPGRFVDNGDDTFTIYPADPGNFTFSTTAASLADTENLETVVGAYNAIKEFDDDFYFVTSYSHDPADIEALADTVQAENKIYAASYKGADAINPIVTSDIGSKLKDKDLSNTLLIYAENLDEYPECAFVGLQAPKDPGSTTWKFKSVSGVTVSKLSTTASLTLKGTEFDYGKGYNTYEDVAGRNILREGRMVNGEFIDTIRFSHWLEARMRERIYLTLVNSEKIPYTAAGFAIIEGRMREVLQEGVAVGGLVQGSINVTVPNPRTLDPNLRANRVADGFEFEATLAGAVHFVKVRGRLQI